MVGLKALMRHVGTSTDVGFLEHAWRCVHCAADVEALNDNVREWNRLCVAEHEIETRIDEVKRDINGGAK